MPKNRRNVLLEKGRSLTHANRFHEALEVFNKLERKKLDEHQQNEVNEFRIKIHERLNNLEKAYEIAESKKVRNCRHFGTHVARARVFYRYKEYGKLIELLNFLIAKPEMDAESKSEACFLLGDTYDKLGQEDKAMRFYETANMIAEQLPKFQHYDKHRPFRFIQAMEDNLHEITRNVSNNTEQPVFLIGFPRSGTTLLRKVLGAHSQTDIVDEQMLFPIVDDSRLDLGHLTSMTDQEMQDICSQYWRNISGIIDTSKLVIDKMPFRITTVPLIYKFFPNAKFIFLVRHPLDACLSNFFQDFEINDSLANCFRLDETFKLYDRFLEIWDKYQRELPLNVHYIYYESMVQDMRSEVGSLLDFLGLDWEPSLEEYYKQRDIITTPSYRQVSQKPYTSSIGRWERYNIDPKTLGKWIRRFGYGKQESDSVFCESGWSCLHEAQQA